MRPSAGHDRARDPHGSAHEPVRSLGDGPLKPEPPRASRTRLWLLALCLLAFALRAAVVWSYEARHPQAETLLIDERSYDSWARAIAAGDWIGHEVFFQEPLYPYALAGVFALGGGDRTPVRMLQAGLGALCVALVWLLARRLFGARAAWIAALLLALYPPHWHLAALLLKENLFLPALTALALAGLNGQASIERGGRGGAAFAAAGVLGALGALLRGNLLVMLPLLAAWPLAAAWRARRPLRAGLPAALALGLGAALVLLPVALRNYRVGGVFALTTSGAGTNLYGGNNEQNRYGIATEFDWVRGIPEHEAKDWEHEAERRVGRELSPTEVSNYWMGEVWRSLRLDPALHLSILWNKLRFTLGWFEVPDNHSIYWDARYVPLLALPIPGFGLLGWLGVAGCAWWLTRSRRDASEPAQGARIDALALLALAYLGTVVLTVTSDRIRLGLVPLLAPFAGALLAALASRPRPALARLALCGLVAAAFAWSCPYDAAQRAKELDERDYNAAALALAEPNGLATAAELAQQLETRYPNSARVQTLQAEIEWRRGLLALAQPGAREDAARRAAAIADYQLALDRLKRVVQTQGVNARERHRAERLAGFVQFDLGQYAVAERRLREALDFDPEDREVLELLARALVLLAESAQGPERSARANEALERLTALERAQPAPARAAWIERARQAAAP